MKRIPAYLAVAVMALSFGKFTKPLLAEIDAPEYSVSLDLDENRYVLKLKQRVGKDKFKEIRRSGWLWSPSREAFVRKCSPQARWAAQSVGRFFEKKDERPLDAKAALG